MINLDAIEIPKEIDFNVQTGTSYTLVLTDAQKYISLDNASAISLTVPTNASVAFKIGTQIIIEQRGAGQVTVDNAGVTVNADPGKKITAQFRTAALVKTATDTWTLFGSLQA